MRMLRVIVTTAALSVMSVFAFLGVVHLLDIVAGRIGGSPIVVSHDRLDFGKIPLNVSATQDLLIRNEGAGPLHARFTTQQGVYRVEPAELYLEPGIEWRITVEARADEPGRLVDLLRIQIVGGVGAPVLIPLDAEAEDDEAPYEQGDEMNYV